jgi:hypothetical protein
VSYGLTNYNSASWEVHAVIRFISAKNMNIEEINREVCADYDQTVMSEGTVRQ